MEEGISPLTKLILVVSVLFFFSCYKSWEEMWYWLSGKESQAQVTSIAERRGKYGRLAGYTVWYDFTNENTHQRASGSDPVSIDDAADYYHGQTVQIQYYGGDMPTSRIKGTGTTFWVWFFVLSSLVMTATITMLTVQWARNQEKPARRARR